jgi:hypothetical protein
MASSSGHIGDAVRTCRATIQFREEHQVSTIRSCLELQLRGGGGAGTTTNQHHHPLRSKVHSIRLANSGIIMELQGCDDRGRANLQIKPASPAAMPPSLGTTTTTTTQASSWEASIYMLETAIACAEMNHDCSALTYHPVACSWPTIGCLSKSGDSSSSDTVIVSVDFQGGCLGMQFFRIANE